MTPNDTIVTESDSDEMWSPTGLQKLPLPLTTIRIAHVYAEMQVWCSVHGPITVCEEGTYHCPLCGRLMTDEEE